MPAPGARRVVDGSDTTSPLRHGSYRRFQKDATTFRMTRSRTPPTIKAPAMSLDMWFLSSRSPHLARHGRSTGRRPTRRSLAFANRRRLEVIGVARAGRQGVGTKRRHWLCYYPLTAATAVIDGVGGVDPKEPLNGLFEKLKIPPSAPTMR